MEKIEALVDVLGMFGQELGNIKDSIADIQQLVLKKTTDLKKELGSFKENLKKNESNTKAMYFSDAEKEIQERIHKLKVEIGKLELLKRKKEEALLNNNNSDKGKICNHSVKGVSKRLRDSLTKMRLASSSIEDVNHVNSTETQTCKPTSTEDTYEYQSYSLSSPTPDPGRVVVQPCKENNDKNSSDLPDEWWKEQNKHKRVDDYIDWKKEFAERKQCKQNLMIKEGWKKMNSSYEDLEAIFKMWTGKSIKWTVLKRGKEKTGKVLFNVRFDSMEDRDKVFNMRKNIAEEGFLFVGEDLSYIEKKERWTMLMMAERLKSEGRNVEFENRRICVDGEWWKYDWVDGWKRV